MANVFVKNKKNGVTYVYQSESYWDKEKKQSRSKRVCIGKLDENPTLPLKKAEPLATASGKGFFGIII